MNKTLGLTLLVSCIVLPLFIGCSESGNTMKCQSQEVKKGALYVQNAPKASLADGKLRLSDVGKTTLYFTDQPERQAGCVKTQTLMEKWQLGKASEKPNAMLTIMNTPQPEEIVLTLKDAKVDGEDIVYEVDVLRGSKSASGEAATLFIDPVVINFRPARPYLLPPPPDPEPGVWIAPGPGPAPLPHGGSGPHPHGGPGPHPHGGGPGPHGGR